MSNIVRIKIKNFMSIADAEITPGQVNQIVGANGQGKTTIMNAIEWAAKGYGDQSLIRIGEDSAEVMIELPDTTTIRRRVNAKGTRSVEVKRDGMVMTSPQAYLDSLFASSSFNPLELVEPKGRTETILKAIPLVITPRVIAERIGVDESELPYLDYSHHGLKVLDQAHTIYFHRRAEANRDAKNKLAKWKVNHDQLGEAPKVDLDRDQLLAKKSATEESIAAYRHQITQANNARAAHDQASKKIEAYQKAVELIKVGIASAQNEAKRAKAELESQHALALERLKMNQGLEMEKLQTSTETQIAGLSARLRQGEQAISEAEASVPVVEKHDLEELTAFLVNGEKTLEEINLKMKDVELSESWAKQSAMVKQMHDEATEAERLAENLTATVEALAGPIRRELMEVAEMPVDGLTYVDGSFFVNGVAVDNLSTSESMTLAVAIARKLSGKSKIICLDGAEALDENTWAALRAEIEDDGFVYFVSRVGEAFEGNDQVIRMKSGAAEVVSERHS